MKLTKEEKQNLVWDNKIIKFFSQKIPFHPGIMKILGISKPRKS